MHQTARRREIRREAIRLEHSSLMKRAQTEITARFDLTQKRLLVPLTLSKANQIARLSSNPVTDQPPISSVVRGF